MAILITGGCGYIGSHTCIEMLNAGYDVVVIDNYYNSKPEALDRVKELAGKDFPFYNCDIRDEEGLRKVFSAHKIDAVIHFAGLKAVGESVEKPLEYYDNNVNGTLVMYRVMKEFGCKRIVFSSSATVYGGVNAPYIWLNCPNGMGSWEFFDYLLNEIQVVGTPGEGFGACGEGYFRFSTFGSPEDTKEAAKRLVKLIGKK